MSYVNPAHLLGARRHPPLVSHGGCSFVLPLPTGIVRPMASGNGQNLEAARTHAQRAIRAAHRPSRYASVGVRCETRRSPAGLLAVRRWWWSS